MIITESYAHDRWFRNRRQFYAMASAIQLALDDFQTSDAHHPDHVLIPATTMAAMRAAIAKATGA